jgi:hypothetical protein
MAVPGEHGTLNGTLRLRFGSKIIIAVATGLVVPAWRRLLSYDNALLSGEKIYGTNR